MQQGDESVSQLTSVMSFLERVTAALKPFGTNVGPQIHICYMCLNRIFKDRCFCEPEPGYRTQITLIYCSVFFSLQLFHHSHIWYENDIGVTPSNIKIRIWGVARVNATQTLYKNAPSRSSLELKRTWLWVHTHIRTGPRSLSGLLTHCATLDRTLLRTGN